MLLSWLRGEQLFCMLLVHEGFLYDVSKNRSGTWCTMAMCGNRLKAQAYRQRRKVRDA
jgi:predicted RNA-binding Zn ribbon-like protein